MKKNNLYISLGSKFLISFFLALSWAALSIWLSYSWYLDLSEVIGKPLSFLLIMGIAILPGFINSFLLASLLLDRRKPVSDLKSYPAVTVLIAAFNERDHIDLTIQALLNQKYDGDVEIIVIDDGSTDGTSEIVKTRCSNQIDLRCLTLPKNKGKANALNEGLRLSKYSLIITLDADSYLYRDALKNIVKQQMSGGSATAAVAGAVMVKNSRFSWLSRAQEWEYFQGITTVKRVQSMYSATLVAQGAFSIYTKKALLQLGGWPLTVGEDIVLTWGLLKLGYKVDYCESAIAFTVVPSSLGQLIKQRQRWARGMIEAFKAYPQLLSHRKYLILFIWWDFFFPLLDLTFTFAFIPGIILASFGHYWIVGPMTLALLPISVALNYVMYYRSSRLFLKMGLHVRSNYFGLLLYAFPFSLIVQPAAVYGYCVELLGLRKKWGTK